MEYEYKGYNPGNAKHVNKYVKSHYKTVAVLIDKDTFINDIEPYIQASGESKSEFFKRAALERIARIKAD